MDIAEVVADLNEAEPGAGLGHPLINFLTWCDQSDEAGLPKLTKSLAILSSEPEAIIRGMGKPKICLILNELRKLLVTAPPLRLFLGALLPTSELVEERRARQGDQGFGGTSLEAQEVGQQMRELFPNLREASLTSSDLWVMARSLRLLVKMPYLGALSGTEYMMNPSRYEQWKRLQKLLRIWKEMDKMTYSQKLRILLTEELIFSPMDYRIRGLVSDTWNVVLLRPEPLLDPDEPEKDPEGRPLQTFAGFYAADRGEVMGRLYQSLEELGLIKRVVISQPLSALVAQSGWNSRLSKLFGLDQIYLVVYQVLVGKDLDEVFARQIAWYHAGVEMKVLRSVFTRLGYQMHQIYVVRELPLWPTFDREAMVYSPNPHLHNCPSSQMQIKIVRISPWLEQQQQQGLDPQYLLHSFFEVFYDDLVNLTKEIQENLHLKPPTFWQQLGNLLYDYFEEGIQQSLLEQLGPQGASGMQYAS